MKTGKIWQCGLICAALGGVMLWIQGCIDPWATDSCTRPPDAHFYMTAEDSAAVPYRGGETLRYQRSINGVVTDTLVFESVWAGEDETEGDDCWDGCPQEAVFHHPEWVYQTADGEEELKFRLELDAIQCYGVPERSASIIDFHINNKYIIGVIPEKFGFDELWYNYHESITINNTEYYGVWSSESSSTKSVFSKEFGFLVAQRESTQYSLIR